MQVAQNESYVSLKLAQKILDLVSDSDRPLELLPWAGTLILAQDTIQLDDEILDFSQGSVSELVSQTSGRLAVAVQELRKALSRCQQKLRHLAHLPTAVLVSPQVAGSNSISRH